MRTTEPDPSTQEAADQTLDTLWDRGDRPDLRAFLATLDGASLSSDELLAVLRVDQRRRWLAGERIDVTSYRRDFPVLASQPEALFELIFSEFLIREDLGEHPDPIAFSTRFPEFADRFQLQMEVHTAFSAEGLDEPADPAAAPARRAEGIPSPRLPDISGYEILGEIGRGGMGVVYRAQQHRPRRAVALKMILDGRFASEHDLRRFENEAEIIGALDHPNIVPILEFGQHEGLHYFSMPLLGGGSLAESQPRLSKDPRAVARLVAEVADAVHHAHRRGILHRDLKPANILLDDEGRPHITDFSLSKRADANRNLTEAGAVMGSPGYMSPEQAAGDPTAITTATDVYGLGAILYALLTGHAPFEGSSPREVIARLQDHAPEAPSRVNRGVPRPLELICLKCLEKDPARRYASADAVSEDLRCWLAGEPIAARPVSTTVRLGMWIRRHPWEASLAAGLVLALVGGVGAVLLYAEDLRRSNLDKEDARRQASVRLVEVMAERKRLDQTVRDLRSARAQETKARRDALDRYTLALEVFEKTFYGSGFQKATGEGSILRMPNIDGLRQRTVSHTLELYAQLEAAIETDPTPEARARLAHSYGMLSEMAGNVEHVDAAIEAQRRAARIRAELVAYEPKNLQRRLDHVDAVRKLGGLQWRSGRQENALASFRTSYDLLVEANRAWPANPEIQRWMSQSLGYIGSSLVTLGRREEGLKSYERALAIRTEQLRNNPKNAGLRFDRASSLITYAHTLRGIAHVDDAVSALVEARAELEALHRDQPLDRLTNLRLLECTNTLADTYWGQGRVDLAVSTTEVACTLADNLVRHQPDVANFRSWQADMRWHLYNRSKTDGKAARPALDQAVRLYDDLVRSFPGVDSYRRNLANSLFERGLVARSAHDLPTAEDSFRRYVDQITVIARERDDGAADSELALARVNLAIVLIEGGALAEALPLIEAVAKDLARLKPPPAAATYDLACARALLAHATPPGPERKARTDQAMNEFRNAVDAGFRNLAHIQADHDLDVLRERSDFQSVLEDLSVPVNVFVR